MEILSGEICFRRAAGNDLAVWRERTIFAAEDERCGIRRATIIPPHVKPR